MIVGNYRQKNSNIRKSSDCSKNVYKGRVYIYSASSRIRLKVTDQELSSNLITSAL